MPSLIATHEVDDVAHWLSSPKREEVFASVASNIRTFVDPSRANHVGLSMDVADMAAFQSVMERGGRGGNEVRRCASGHRRGLRGELTSGLTQPDGRTVGPAGGSMAASWL